MIKNKYVDGSEYNGNILPCPFCGGEADIEEGYDDDMNASIPKYFVSCNDCSAQGPEFSTFDHKASICKTKAIAAWNKRV